MRIDGRTERIWRLWAQGPTAPGQSDSARDRARALQQADHVTLSSRAREMKQLYQALSTVPTERAERVAALRQAVADGTYVIPEEALASRLLGVIYPER